MKQKKDSSKKATSKIPFLKEYLIERGITQKVLAEQTFLSTGTVHKLVNKGIACRSVILLVAYSLNVPYDEMVVMIQTTSNKQYHKEKGIK